MNSTSIYELYSVYCGEDIHLRYDSIYTVLEHMSLPLGHVPIIARTMPVRMMITSAMSFAYVNTSCTRVESFVEKQLIKMIVTTEYNRIE